MFTNHFSRSLSLAVALFVLPASITLASTRFSESFSEPVNGVPQGWLAVKGTEAAVAEIQAVPGGGNGLLIQRPPNEQGSAALFYTGSSDGIADGVLGDFVASVTFRFDEGTRATSSSRGFLIRAGKKTYQKSQGYYIAVQPTGKNSGLGIYWNPANHVENGSEVVFAPFDALQVATDYVLQVKAKGATIEAEVWSVDGAGARKELIGSVKTDEANASSEGFFALRGAYGNSGPVSTWFRSLHLELDSK